MKEMSNTPADIRSFLREGIWRLRLKDLSGGRKHLVMALRMLVISCRKFIADECALWSSALTFYTLMSIVPVAAVIFAIAKGFGLKQLLEERLTEQFAENREAVTAVIGFSERLLENTQGELLAGVGVIVLLWSVIMLMGNIEQSFNKIWGVTKPRSLGRKFSDYLSVMIISPVLLITSNSAALLIRSELHTLTGRFGMDGILVPLTAIAVRFIPFVLIWILLSFMYIFIPNRKVSPASGIIAGGIAGLIFITLERIYIHFQIGVASYNAIYGSFAALPLLFIFLMLSWLIVLFGTELSYAHQNVNTCAYGLEMSPYVKRLISLKIVHHIIVRFGRGEPGLTATSLSEILGLPLALIHTFISELRTAGIILEASSSVSGGEPSFVPARGTDSITVASVIEALTGQRKGAEFIFEESEIRDLEEILTDFDNILEASLANRLLRDIPLSG